MTDELKSGQTGKTNEPLPPPPPVLSLTVPEGANVILAHGHKAVTEEGTVNIGSSASIELPNLEQQKVGFTIEEKHLNTFLQQFQGRYKRLVPKGGNS